MILRALSVGLAVAVAACSGSAPSDLFGASSSESSGSSTTTAPGGTTTMPPPEPEKPVDPPPRSVDIDATIIAATLGDDCGGGFGAGDCAPTPDGKGCGLVCQQSNLQLSFRSREVGAARIEIVSVTLHDAKTGAKLDTLAASDPRVWNGSAYTPWNEVLAPSADVKATYDLSAPSWSTFPSGKTYSTQYRLQVSLRIDGVNVTLESATLSREPPVAT